LNFLVSPASSVVFSSLLICGCGLLSAVLFPLWMRTVAALLHSRLVLFCGCGLLSAVLFPLWMRTVDALLYFPCFCCFLFSVFCPLASVYSVFRGAIFPLHLGTKRARPSIEALSRFLRDAQSCGFCVRHSTRRIRDTSLRQMERPAPKSTSLCFSPQAPAGGCAFAPQSKKRLFQHQWKAFAIVDSFFFQKKSLILPPAASTNSFFWREAGVALAPQQPVNRLPYRPTVIPSIPPV
jgi:hypothetical protein